MIFPKVTFSALSASAGHCCNCKKSPHSTIIVIIISISRNIVMPTPKFEEKKLFVFYHCYNYSVSYNTYICTWLWWPLSSSYYNHCQKLWKSTTSVLSHTGVSVVVVIIISVLIIIIVVVVINRSTVAILERVLTQLNNAIRRCNSHHWELI